MQKLQDFETCKHMWYVISINLIEKYLRLNKFHKFLQPCSLLSVNSTWASSRCWQSFQHYLKIALQQTNKSTTNSDEIESKETNKQTRKKKVILAWD